MGHDGHYKPKQKLSTRQELVEIGGDLRFWDYFKAEFKANHGGTFVFLRKKDCRKIICDAQSLHGKLEMVGISSRDQLMVMLRNLQLLFSSEINQTAILRKDETGKIELPDYLSDEHFADLLKYDPCNLTAYAFPNSSKKPTKFPKDSLYYFIPGLVLYTAFLCDGVPQWVLISKLIEEVGLMYEDKDGSLKRWWAESIETLTNKRYQKLDVARKQLLSTSVEAYLVWKSGGAKGLWDETGVKLERKYQKAPIGKAFGKALIYSGPSRDSEEKRYQKIVEDKLPFLRNSIRNILPHIVFTPRP